MDIDPRMRAYARREDGNGHRSARQGLTHDLLNGLRPDEFSGEARALQDARMLTPEVRERLKQLLVEPLKASVDTPTWEPDWVLRHAKRLLANLRFSPASTIGKPHHGANVPNAGARFTQRPQIRACVALGKFLSLCV